MKNVREVCRGTKQLRPGVSRAVVAVSVWKGKVM